MLLIKSICPMWTHQGLKKKWETPKRNAAKCYILCTFQDVKPTQETAGSGLNRLYNVLCLLWNIHSGALLPRIYSITNTKHWITYTYFYTRLMNTADNAVHGGNNPYFGWKWDIQILMFLYVYTLMHVLTKIQPWRDVSAQGINSAKPPAHM